MCLGPPAVPTWACAAPGPRAPTLVAAATPASSTVRAQLRSRLPAWIIFPPVGCVGRLTLRADRGTLARGRSPDVNKWKWSTVFACSAARAAELRVAGQLHRGLEPGGELGGEARVARRR